MYICMYVHIYSIHTEENKAILGTYERRNICNNSFRLFISLSQSFSACQFKSRRFLSCLK